jgi:enamine deaminase RidA (YjgF/YER057c/UK114 family)
MGVFKRRHKKIIYTKREGINNMSNDRKRVSSGSPYEKTIGFSRAVRVGNRIIIAGTAPIAPDGTSAAVGDVYGQAKRCLEIIENAITEAGGSMADVVRTRMYLTDAKYEADVGRAHGEFFSDIRPAATMVVVKGLVRDEWLVEMEAEAIVDK